MTGNFYNGFSPRERRAWRAPDQPLPSRCSMCGCGPERSKGWHSEDYRTHDSIYGVCRRCHHAIHIRFVRPDHWRRYIADLPPEAWCHGLSLDPVALTRPFDDTYPQGLPPPPDDPD